MTTKEQLEKLVLGNRFIQSPRLQKLYKELLDRLEAENKQCDINGVSRSLPEKVVKISEAYVEDADLPSGILCDGRYSEVWVLEKEYRKNKTKIEKW